MPKVTSDRQLWVRRPDRRLWAGAENRLLVLGRSDTQVVLAIERSQQFSGSISRLTADLTSTIDLTLD
jgi:hypothetical protein